LKSGSSSVCCICFDETDSLKVWYDSEGPCHAACLECFSEYAKGAINERRCPPLQFNPTVGVVLTCPLCSSLSLKNWNCHIMYLLGQDMYNQFQLVSAEFHMSRQSNKFTCPNASCGVQFLQDEVSDNSPGSMIICPECRLAFCQICFGKYHPGKSCTDYVTENPQELETILLKADMKKCPSCHSPAEKISGCNHMTCIAPFCDTEWCWVCGDVWSLQCSTNHWGIEPFGDADSDGGFEDEV